MLSGMQIGSRAWFVFTPDAACALHLAPLSAAGARLLRMRAPRTKQTAVGFVSVGGDGVLRLFSPNATEDVLPALARWVQAEAPGAPGLGRLCGAEVFRVGDDGEVLRRDTDASAWAGISPLPVLGSPAAADTVLASLAVGEEAWFWLTAAGPGGAPLFVAQPVAGDPRGRRFALRLEPLRRLCARNAAAAQGLARRTDAGVTLIATAAAPGWAAVARSLAGAAPSLRRARLVEADGDTLVSADERPDLSVLSAALAALGDTERWFWFDGVHLHLATDRAALTSLPAHSGAWRGRLRQGPGGTLTLRVRSPDIALLKALGRWGSQHVQDWPVLSVLRGACLSARGVRGTIQDPTAWQSPAWERHA